MLDLTPRRIDSIRIDGPGKVFDLVLEPGGWQLVGPVKEQADNAAVQSLLMRFPSLKASEFLDPASVPEPRLDPPAIRVRGWQTESVQARLDSRNRVCFEGTDGRAPDRPQPGPP